MENTKIRPYNKIPIKWNSPYPICGDRIIISTTIILSKTQKRYILHKLVNKFWKCVKKKNYSRYQYRSILKIFYTYITRYVINYDLLNIRISIIFKMEICKRYNFYINVKTWINYKYIIYYIFFNISLKLPRSKKYFLKKWIVRFIK